MIYPANISYHTFNIIKLKQIIFAVIELFVKTVLILLKVKDKKGLAVYTVKVIVIVSDVKRQY